MSKQGMVEYKTMIRHLENQGFVCIGQKGSHRKLRSGNTIVVVPCHPKQKTLKIGIVCQIKKKLLELGKEAL